MLPGFSRRTAWDTEESSLARAIREARAAENPLCDLTVANPTRCGFDYDEAAILGALRSAEAMVYDPDPRGLWVARDAVSAYYGDHGAAVSADQLILTTSTSEAYSFLFRLLCDPGDEVLVAQPGYPLFDFLADLDDVRLVSYPLFHDFGWWIDFAELERRITSRTRAVLLVHPNNPTGHATSLSERLQLEEICVRRGLALVVDEVFLDYGLKAPVRSFAAGEHPALTFVLSGLSKVCALPQMKCGWVACLGPEQARAEALARLEVIADTFLSMNAPVQLALPVWLAGRGNVQGQILERVKANLAVAAGDERVRLIAVEAGWSAVLRLPGEFGSEDLAERLVLEVGLIIHPGAFYGMGEKNLVVVSLLGPSREFAAGMLKLKKWCEPRELT